MSGLRIVAVCEDSVYDVKQKKMVRDLKLTCPVIHDKYGIVARRYECGKALPYTVYIGKNGTVNKTSVGYDTTKNAVITHEINNLIGSKQ